jgi:tripartite-type tricarboxylate transporter receptor subunit TctC
MQARFFALMASALAASLPASAQDYPNRPVTIVAPAAPGGLYSLFARLIGSKLEQRLGKPSSSRTGRGQAPSSARPM